MTILLDKLILLGLVARFVGRFRLRCCHYCHFASRVSRAKTLSPCFTLVSRKCFPRGPQCVRRHHALPLFFRGQRLVFADIWDTEVDKRTPKPPLFRAKLTFSYGLLSHRSEVRVLSGAQITAIRRFRGLVHVVGRRVEPLTICPCPKAMDKKSGHSLGQARDVSGFLRVFSQ